MRAIVALAFLALPGTAFAQDKCSDVLKDGPFSYAQMSRNDYFNQLVYSRFYQSTYDQARNDRALGFGVPVGEIVLGGNFSEGSHRSYGRTTERQYFGSLTSAQQMDLALMTGDKEVIGAWRDCMQNRAGGGFSARFQPDSDQQVTLIIEFFPFGDRTRDKLAEAIALPAGVEVLQNRNCLRRGYTYRVNAPCPVTLRVLDRRTDWKVAIRGAQSGSSATAWLPKRPVLVQYEDYYPFTDEQKLNRTMGNCCSNIPITNTIELTAQQIQQGWTFDASSANLRLYSRSHSGSGDNRCHSEYAQIDGTRMIYGYALYAPDRQRRDGKVTCNLSLSVKMRRNFWSYDPSEDEVASDFGVAGPAANIAEDKSNPEGLVPAFN